jgi:1-acyl-sn-glycerol-3-phosphate acyltransferase
LAALKNGGVLTLFPEGTRSPDGTLQSAKPGIGLIAAKSQSAIVPCRIFNAHKALSKESKLPNLNLSIHIVYGKPLLPIDYDPGKSAGKQRYQQIADNIMSAISKIKRPRLSVV